MDGFDKEELEGLLAVFRDQTLMLLDEIGLDLLAIESETGDQEAWARMRRAAHTIKGDAACLGLDGITGIAHRLEDVFDAVVSGGGVTLDRSVVDAVLRTLDIIRISVGSDNIEDVDLDALQRVNDDFPFLPGREPDVVRAGEAGESTQETKAEARAPRKRMDLVRVEAGRIDALLNLAGEMVIAKSGIDRLFMDLASEFPKSEAVTNLGRATGQIGRLVAQLQKSVLKMRMVAIDQMFRRFTRPMRELAQERGKNVEIEMRGGDTELDRTLVDLLYEPILHLLRNAVDHGLETEDERRRLGKPPAGCIGLLAYHEGNQVVVEVSDDGRGIDVEALKSKAVDSGLIDHAEATEMSEEEALELLFHAGLSTAKEITWVSGRGIGAATVKEVVEQLRGSVTIASEKGRGTTFFLRLPLTLAIIKALLFRAGPHLLALPLLAVSEIARARPEETLFLEGFESYRLRDQFISIVRPGQVLGYDRRVGGPGSPLRSRHRSAFVIVVSLGERRYGLVADELVGEQELVIKPLDGKWIQNDALAGASILGDGSVVLILDAGTVLRKAARYERTLRRA